MSRNLKLSYVLTFVLLAITLAWNTLLAFFNGVGVNFIAVLAIVIALLVILLVDDATRKRMLDLFIICALLAVMECVVYFGLEFGNPTIDTYSGMRIYQNVISGFGFVFLAWVIFRLICEIKNIRLGFVEVILGNQKCQKKNRQPKDLSNGSLSEKPNKSALETLDSDDPEITVEDTGAEMVDDQDNSEG